MKLVFAIAFLLFLNVVWAEQPHRRGAPKIGPQLHRRENELPHEIYNKRDDDAGVSKRLSIMPYPPYYSQSQFQCEMCCNGTKFNGLYPYSSSCCGSKIYDSSTATCCGSSVIFYPTTTNTYQWQCCGESNLYNSSAQICCGNQTYLSQPFQQCCGSKTFNATSQICCGNAIQQMPAYNTWSCCGSTVYDNSAQVCNNGQLGSIQSVNESYACGSTSINFTNQICCNNVAIKRVNNYTLCCGSAGYQANQQICCGSKIFADNQSGTQGCCGDQQMDLNTQTCCNGNPVPTPTGADCASFYCCGSQLYNSASQTSLCCNGQVSQTISPSASGLSSKIGFVPPSYYPSYNQYQCCGSQTYNTQNQTCCGNTNVVNGQNALCCGNSTYDASQQTCCNNALYEVGKVPPNICCCPNGGCNNYYPIYPTIF